MLIRPIKTRIFKEGENLLSFITQHLKTIPEGSVLAITSKIVALSQKRTALIKNSKTKEQLIKKESDLAISTKYVWLTVKDGTVLATAGIDESNGNGKLILLPKDSFKAAQSLRKKLQKKYRLKKLGIIITDSRTLPFHAGTTGVALGYAGFSGIKNYRGTLDIFGKKLQSSRVDVADSLATAAVLTMGEGREQQPLALIKNAPIQFKEKINPQELHIDFRDDMYRPIFQKKNKPKK